ncbi:hypothetical protein D9619_010539 [Psilocybe cf. subviscida]|uniref:Uncharacterized protein n=1 Tax=Psilocybe cf. subviscida TaxID=2480587 RepID=A0A8H5ASG3_9AGAR|nr:hypothetical protein D9619_010539 [Psilocybe cf. subviscida]
MLVFFALCAFLQTPLGASVPPSNTSSSAATPDAFGAMACECPISSSDDGGEHLRTVYDIVKSCLLTIFACVWQSAHPNINGPRDSGWARLKRRIVTMLCMIIAPEAALVWALQQRSSAKEIAETYNKEFAKVEMETSLWRKVKGWFLPLPKETTWRGDGQLWTTTHGFFIQMGGFILYDNGYPKEVLNYERLAELLRSEKIDAPAVTERDLQDRSKGDAISKAIVVVQTIWFVLQCFARWGQHLPLSELEVITLAFAVMNAAIYAVWWNKPQGVDMAISVPLKSAKEEVGVSTISTDEVLQEEINGSEHPQLRESVSLHQGDYQQLHVDDGLPLIPRDEQQWDESTGERHSWLRRKLREDREQHSPPLFFLCYLPIRIVGSVFRPLGKMLGGHLHVSLAQYLAPSTSLHGHWSSPHTLTVYFGGFQQSY